MLGRRYFPDVAVEQTRGRPAAGVYQPTRRTDSNMFSLVALLEQVAVDVSGDRVVSIGSAVIPAGGSRAAEGEPGLFDAGGVEYSFADVSGRRELQRGAPVMRYVAVPWWRNARLVVPPVMISVLVAFASTLAAPFALFRRRRLDTRDRRLKAATRAALAADLLAMIAALWLVLPASPMVVLESAAVVPIAMCIYALAWVGVLLAPMAVWGAGRAWRRRDGWFLLFRHTIEAGAAVVLALFLLVWRIAGTDLQF